MVLQNVGCPVNRLGRGMRYCLRRLLPNLVFLRSLFQCGTFDIHLGGTMTRWPRSLLSNLGRFPFPSLLLALIYISLNRPNLEHRGRHLRTVLRCLPPSAPVVALELLLPSPSSPYRSPKNVMREDPSTLTCVLFVVWLRGGMIRVPQEWLFGMSRSHGLLSRTVRTVLGSARHRRGACCCCSRRLSAAAVCSGSLAGDQDLRNGRQTQGAPSCHIQCIVADQLRRA